MRITENQLRGIVRSLIREEEENKNKLLPLDKDAFNKALNHIKDDPDYGSDDAKGVAYAVKDSLLALGGNYAPAGGDRKEWEKNIEAAGKNIEDSAGSLLKNRADNKDPSRKKILDDQIEQKLKASLGGALQFRYTRS
jgi:hypothetical protein